MSSLNAAQREILRLFAQPMSESDLLAFLAKKAVVEADKAFEERGYSDETIEEWKSERMRRKSSR